MEEFRSELGIGAFMIFEVGARAEALSLSLLLESLGFWVSGNRRAKCFSPTII